MKQTTRIRHLRIIDIRKMVRFGKTESEIIHYCLNRLKVSKVTALSYFEEAATPYRKKYQESQY